jgi:hypothetical protein
MQTSKLVFGGAALLAVASLTAATLFAGDVQPPGNSPPVFVAPSLCNTIVNIAPNVELVLFPTAVDPEENPMVLFNAATNAPGATFGPQQFIVDGSPIQGEFHFTPSIQDAGQIYFALFVAIDFVEGGGSGIGSSCLTLIQVDEALSAELSEFKGGMAFNGGPVSIQWATSSEIDNAYFNIYRSETTFENATLVNQGPIMALGGPSIPASYQQLDRLAQAGHVYKYWLESTDIYGATQVYGPIQVLAR